MSKWIKVAGIAMAALYAMCPACMAAKAKPKLANKATVPHIVKGTTQLSGENAQFGTTYTLGKSNPINITIKSAQYSVEPILIGDRLYTVNAKEKLLVLHMTYHNPQNADRFVRSDSFGFTAVDAQDQNHDGLLGLGAESDKTSVSMSMKPAQKKDVYCAMTVPAAGEIPKLIIKANDNTVLRYNLIGKVKGLPAPYADPSDKTGATALAKMAGTIGTAYPVELFYMKLNKVEYTDATTMGDTTLRKGDRFLIVQFSLRNASPSEAFFRSDSFKSKLIDTDSVEVGNLKDLFQASKDRSFSGNIEPAQEMTLRYVFTIPNDTDLKTFRVSRGEGRTYEFDISDVK